MMNGDIEPKSEITKVDLGYYNSLQTTSAYSSAGSSMASGCKR